MTVDLSPEQTKAEMLVEEWKKRLRLQDWRTKVTMIRQYDTIPTAAASCSPCLSLKSAAIRVVSEADHDLSVIKGYDMEQLIVHELLHLHFAPFMPDSDEGLMHAVKEQAIDLISEALVNAKRFDNNQPELKSAATA